jgi:hypothetical protein
MQQPKPLLPPWVQISHGKRMGFDWHCVLVCVAPFSAQVMQQLQAHQQQQQEQQAPPLTPRQHHMQQAQQQSHAHSSSSSSSSSRRGRVLQWPGVTCRLMCAPLC